MAPRGRPPKPLEQRVAEGNPGKRPLPAPVLVGGRPTPEEFSQPPADIPEDGRQWWMKNVPRLVELGIIDRIDETVLEQLAVLYSRIKQARRVIREDGHFAKGSTGQLVKHPALSIEESSTKLFMQLAEQYALTPTARTRLGLAELNRQTAARELLAELQGDDGEELEDIGEVVDDDTPVDVEVVD